MEVAVVIALISLIVSVLQMTIGAKRNNKNDTKAETSQLTTVIVKLENIGNDISEMKTDLRDMKDDLRDHSERLVKAEQQIKVLNNTVFKRGGYDE